MGRGRSAAARPGRHSRGQRAWERRSRGGARALRVLARHTHGFEVSSGGELEHAAAAVPDHPLAFGGPGKTADELAIALKAGTSRFHVESPHELAMLDASARAAGTQADVLLR